jgi:hypothetical protein
MFGYDTDSSREGSIVLGFGYCDIIRFSSSTSHLVTVLAIDCLLFHDIAYYLIRSVSCKLI